MSGHGTEFGLIPTSSVAVPATTTYQLQLCATSGPKELYTVANVRGYGCKGDGFKILQDGLYCLDYALSINTSSTLTSNVVVAFAFSGGFDDAGGSEAGRGSFSTPNAVRQDLVGSWCGHVGAGGIVAVAVRLDRAMTLQLSNGFFKVEKVG